MREVEITMMTEKVRMSTHVYDNTGAYGMQLPLTEKADWTNYVIANEEFEKFEVIDTGSSLSQIFLDKKDKKVTIAMGGLLAPIDETDRKMAVQMGYAMRFPKKVDKGRITDFW